MVNRLWDKPTTSADLLHITSHAPVNRTGKAAPKETVNTTANKRNTHNKKKQKEEENKQLAQKLNQMDTNYVDQYSGRVESQLAQTEQNLRAAMEVGDTEAAVAAQKEMTRLAVEADRAAQAKAANEQRNKAAEAQTASSTHLNLLVSRYSPHRSLMRRHRHGHRKMNGLATIVP